MHKPLKILCGGLEKESREIKMKWCYEEFGTQSAFVLTIVQPWLHDKVKKKRKEKKISIFSFKFQSICLLEKHCQYFWDF